jgi:RsmE family RNA methyltransferase
MNQVLLEPEDLLEDGTARLTGRRLRHVLDVLRVAEGDVLRVGLLGGRIGTAEVLKVDGGELLVRPSFIEPPPPRAGIDLLLAIPRPKALRKVLPAAASLGVDRIVLVNAARVEKSYFDSRVLDAAAMRELLILGLEQARDTRVPEILVRERFRPFVEDELDELWPGTVRLVAHPAAEHPPARRSDRTVVAIGPEGGWVPFEIDLLRARGFAPFTFGPRTLRVEVAVPYALGALRAP